MREKLSTIEARAIGVVDFDRCLTGKTVFEKGGETSIELDKNHAFRNTDDVFGQSAGARADLDDGVIFGELELRYDPSRHVRIDEEILPHLFAGQHIEAIERFLDFLAGHVCIS
jgi:hypothetical protein